MDLNSEHCSVGVIPEKFNLRLSQFIYKRVLCSMNGRKSICVEGTLQNQEGIAISFFEKNPISYKMFGDLCIGNSTVEDQLVAAGNSASYQCFPEENVNGMKVMLIFPATVKHVQKYESCPCHIIEETPELYRNVVLPFITLESFNLQWVYNIFDHVAEQESIIYEDEDPKNGFLLATDFKWDRKNIDNLHVLAMARSRNIISLRDLTADHLPLLRNINSKGTEVIKNLFGLSKNQLRIYFHYQPSYYHLHVHFTNVEYQAPGINATKAHSLDYVIRNLELITDYYQKATLSYVLKETDGLYKRIKENENSEEKCPQVISS